MVYAVLVVMILSAIFAVILRNTLLSVFSLATVSLVLSIVFFQLGSPVAGVFELSVGAGLITILIILTLTFIQGKKEENKPTFSALWLILAIIISTLFFAFFYFFTPGIQGTPVAYDGNWKAVGEIIWKERSFDLFPVALIILSAVFAILSLLRKEKETIHE